MAKMVAPSILSADFANLQSEIAKVTQAGADWIHVDVMDGHFVPNLTIGAPVVASLKKVTRIPLDVHLMIENPEKYVPDFIKAGSDYLTIHVESTKDPKALLQMIRAQSVKAGITLKPGTPISAVEPFLELADLVLVMTVEPGFGGQSFMNEQVAKISRLRHLIEQKSLKTLIEVDGGINSETAKLCHQADVFVAGNFVFKNPDGYESAIRSLKQELQKGIS